MKKVIYLSIVLFITTMTSIGANRTGTIRTGENSLSRPMTFGLSDTIITSETKTITISNPQRYLQHQNFTTTIVTVSGTPSVAITAYGKLTATGAWVQIGSPVTWTSAANNPVEIASGAALNYAYLKLAYVASGATQEVKITAFEVKTTNVVSASGSSTVFWTKGGAATGVATGTDVACSNGARWWSELEVPYNVKLTGLAYLVGSVGGTDSVMVHLYNSAGTLVASSKRAGANHGHLVGTATEFQSVPFSATYNAFAGKYYACVQFNGTTAKFRAYLIPGCKFIANTAAGTWDTPAAITAGTTFVASKGPIIMTY
jgi:hypothetical protein